MIRQPLISRRTLLAGSAAAAALTAFPRRGRAATEWILSSAYPDDSHMLRNNRMFAEALSERTEGELTLDVYGNAALYKLPETKRAVQTGQVQLGEVFLGTLSNEDPIYGVGALPFLVKGVDEARALWEVQKPYVKSRLADEGILLLHGVTWPGQSLFSKTPVESFADLEGTKFRVQNPSTARLAELMGVVGVRVETADLPQAFLTGIIDGMYTSNATGANVAVWDYLDYIYETNAWYPKNITFMNMKAFEALPTEMQDIVLEESATAETRGWGMEAEETANANELLRSKGLNVLEPSEELMAEFRKIGAQMVDEWLATAGDDGAALIEEFRSSVG